MKTSTVRTGCLVVCLLVAGCLGGGSGDQMPSRSTTEEPQTTSLVAEAILRRHRETFQLGPAVEPAHGMPSRSASSSSPQPMLALGVTAKFVRKGD